MIKQEIGTVKGKKLYILQSEDRDEAKKLGFPDGIFHCWEFENGERIFSPGTIIMMLQDSAKNGQSIGHEILKPEKIKTYYKKLYDKQKLNIINSLKEIKMDLLKRSHNDAQIKIIDEMINSYENNTSPTPDIDGVARLNINEINTLVDKKHLEEFYSDEEIKEIFDVK